MKELSIEKQIYLCKYHDIDDALNITLGISRNEAQEILNKLKANGMYEQYRKLSEDEYEKAIMKERKNKKTDIKTDTVEEILKKYKFDKNSITYNDIKSVLEECEKIKNEENIVLTDIFKKISQKRKAETYIINNNCKRALNKAYTENKDIFKSMYANKPTLKEFIEKELGIEQKKESVICDITKESVKNIQEVKEKVYKAEDINNVTVPITVMYEYWYLKGFVDSFEGNEIKKF